MDNWIKWTILQGLAGTCSRLLQKIVGVVSVTFGHAAYATFIIGFVQTILGFISARIRGASLITTKANIIGAICFGCMAVISTLLSFLTFIHGRDVGVATFLVTLSIIPGAFIDWGFFDYRLSARQWVGIIFAIIAGYCVLGLPSLKDALQLPLWVTLSLINAITVGINQGISQKIKEIDPFVKNFWVGVTTTLLMGIVLLIDADFPGLFAYQNLGALTKASFVIGFIVTIYLVFNILAFRDGAHISAKKLVFNGTWLITSMVGGIIFFDEEMAVWKFIGILLYLMGFLLIQKKVATVATINRSNAKT